MATARRIIKRVLLSISLLILLLVALVSFIYRFKIPILENQYIRKPSSENLIKLSIQLVRSDDYDRMMKYLPMAAELDDFVEIAKSRKLFLPPNDWLDFKAEETQQAVIVESALSYIYAKRYDDFRQYFPKAFKGIILKGANGYWNFAVNQKGRITEEGYQFIIKELDDYTPKYLEIKNESNEKIREYILCQAMKMSVYDAMGDKETADRINKDYMQILRDSSNS